MKYTETYAGREITITAPDLAFAFNPITIQVDGLLQGNGLLNDATVICNGFKMTKEVMKEDPVYFDLSAIAISMFERNDFHIINEQDNVLYKEIELTVAPIGYKFTIPTIWGALQIGETYTQHKKLTYFKEYPFTIPLFLPAKLDVYFDGVYYKTLDKGKYNIDINDLPNIKNISAFGTEMRSIFDLTFDSTFQPEKVLIPQNISIEINNDNCLTDGVYLRWINKHGEYNYYLFRQTTTANEIKDLDVTFDDSYRTVDYTNKYHNAITKSIGKQFTQTIKLFASLVNAETYSFLIDMLQSPVVDMYFKDVDSWQGVMLADGTFTETTSTLQDLEFSLITNNSITQTL